MSYWLSTEICVGLGSGSGALFGGLVYEAYGPVVLFRAAAVVVAVSLLFFGITQWLCGGIHST